jgi:hypothetical protein
MRVPMIAPPGAGKGTQGALIAAHFGIPRISTGELLRDHVARRTGLGQAVQAYLNRGELVPDQVPSSIPVPPRAADPPISRRVPSLGRDGQPGSRERMFCHGRASSERVLNTGGLQLADLSEVLLDQAHGHAALSYRGCDPLD